MRAPRRSSVGSFAQRLLLGAATILVLCGEAGVHTGHPAGEIETEVFVDARHAGQASHFEATGRVVVLRCPVCLLTAQSHALTPGRATGPGEQDAAQPLRATADAASDRLSRSLSRPRAPPAA